MINSKEHKKNISDISIIKPNENLLDTSMQEPKCFLCNESGGEMHKVSTTISQQMFDSFYLMHKHCRNDANFSGDNLMFVKAVALAELVSYIWKNRL